MPLRASNFNTKLATDPWKSLREQVEEPYPENVAVKAFMFYADDNYHIDGSEFRAVWS